MALAAAFAAPAAAQDGGKTEDELILLDSVTLSASTQPVDLSRTGATVDVITAEEMQKAGNLQLLNQLARLPGVSFTQNGGMGSTAALRLRGLSGPYIGVQIDGIDVADASGTQCQYDFGTTSIAGLSRVEVLRGSQSALYGSSAIGGVVDITTFRATKDGLSAQTGVEAGSNATYSGTASVAYRDDRTELAFSASRTTTEGISTAAAGTEKDGFGATFLSFYGAVNLTEGLRVGINGFARNSHSEFDSTSFSYPYLPVDGADTEDGKLRGGRVFAEFDTGAVENELSYSHQTTSRYYPLGWTQHYDSERDTLSYKGRWKASDQVSLNWGAERMRETFSSDSDGGDTATTSVFGEALYAPTDRLDLSLALRNDDHSVFGSKATGRAAAAWRPTDDWVIRAVVSTGFRAPSLYELYGYYGNTSLTPETSRSLELGAEYLLPGGGSVQATLFDTRIDDKIQWSGGSYNQVPGTSTVRGIELTAHRPLADGWEIYGNYTYTDAYSAAGGSHSRLIRVPRHDLVLGVDARITDRIGGNASLQYVADVLDSGGALPNYTLVNLGVTYALTDTAEAYLRVENALNQDYETVQGYGQPGRQVFVGVRASF